MKKRISATQTELKNAVIACAESIEEAVSDNEVTWYFEDALDVEIITSLCGDYRGARIALAVGGPGIFFDTRTGFVQGYWGNEYFERHLPSYITDAVDVYFAEQWELYHY